MDEGRRFVFAVLCLRVVCCPEIFFEDVEEGHKPARESLCVGLKMKPAK